MIVIGLGFGMNAYFDTLKYMMILMLLIFVFSLPALKIYSSYDALKDGAMYMFTKYSLGNLGKNLYIIFFRGLANNMPDCSYRFNLYAYFLSNRINEGFRC